MKTTLITAVLCTASMLLPRAHAQQSDAGTNQLTLLRAQAEQGDAQGQFELGGAFESGKFGLDTMARVGAGEGVCSPVWARVAPPAGQRRAARCGTRAPSNA